MLRIYIAYLFSIQIHQCFPSTKTLYLRNNNLPHSLVAFLTGSAWCQFHQNFRYEFFVRTSFRQLFFTYIRTYIRRKKAAKTTFVRKKRAKNVDEIDTLSV